MSGRNPTRGGGQRGRGDGQNLPFRPAEQGRGGGGHSRGRGRGKARGDSGDSRGRGRGGGRGQSSYGGSGDVEVFAPGYKAARNDNVQKSEERLQALLKQGGSPDLPNRPGYGTRGKPVLLWANYFELVADSSTVLYRYSLTVEPSQGNRTLPPKIIKRTVQLFINEHMSSGGHDVVSDFRSTLISRRQIELPAEGFTVQYLAEGEDSPAPDAKSYVIHLQDTGSLSLSTLLDYTTSADVSSFFGTKQELLQALNIIVGHQPKTGPGVLTVGRNRHMRLNADSADRASLGAGLEALRAFIFSVRAATERLLMNVQIKNLPFYEPGPLEQLVRSFTRDFGYSRPALANFLQRLSIEVTHLRRTNRSGQRIPRYKTIVGLATRSDGRSLPNPPRVRSYGAGSKQVEFFLQDDSQSGPAAESSKASSRGKGKKKAAQTEARGRYISVFDFFRERYQITIRDDKLPVVNVGTAQNPSYLPMQVCEVRPGQAARGKISPAQTQQMIRFAVRKPAQNARSIVTFGLGLLGLEGRNPYLDAFGISINPRMITVSGRVMQPPSISYASNQSSRPSFGSWNLRNTKFYRGAALQKWTYLIIALEGSREIWQSVQEFHSCLDHFAAKLGDSGLQVNSYTPGIRIHIKPGDPELKIDDALQKFASSADKRPEMVLVIIPSNDKTAVYNRVKHVCDVREGLINVCVVDTNFAKSNDQTFANVGLKVNLKLGGCNHIVNANDLGPISAKETMFVGIDVTHPSPGSLSTAPSIAGIVSSIDEWLAQWPADMRIQEARKEMVDAIDGLIQGCLRRWQTRNGSLPRNIIVFRDGVSEGQYQLVLDTELPALRKGIESVYPATDIRNHIPRLSIIVVGKRHHTRFYATDRAEADRSGNPQNGTVVDRGVTEVANWDFFLQAHAALQGTARPAHYYVIHDEIFHRLNVRAPLTNAADVLEQLSHSICYLFGRATKAVSVCPPAYYADLVCERARCYLSHVYAPTPPESSAASVASEEAGAVQPDNGMIQIHERIRDSMFYI